MKQIILFPNSGRRHPRRYSNVLTVSINRKGVMDVDTVKGCSAGMRTYPNGGCYGECYAYKNARTYGYDFTTSVSRQFMGREHKGTIIKAMVRRSANWYRIGTAGDPSHDWPHTVAIINALWHLHKVPVIITKHWEILTDDQIARLRHLQAVINTSVSGMDSDAELWHRIGQLRRLRSAGLRSVCRVVTCHYGESAWARECQEKQSYLLSLSPTIDNPLRARSANPHVMSGDIIVERRAESVGGGKTVSVNSPSAYLGTCHDCPDQCGVNYSMIQNTDEERSLYEQQAAQAI